MCICVCACVCVFAHMARSVVYVYVVRAAQVLSADAFGAFEDAGLDDEGAVQQTGRRFRDTVLALGGSVPPLEVRRDKHWGAPSWVGRLTLLTCLHVVGQTRTSLP